MVNVPVALLVDEARMSNEVLSTIFSILKVIPLIVKSSNDAPNVLELITLNDRKLLFVRLPFEMVLTTKSSSETNVNVEDAVIV
jgi:hypothetical protein